MDNLSHEPFGVFPRSTFAGEMAFYLEWKAIADTTVLEIIDEYCHSQCENDQWELDWVDYELINKQSRLVASFITWLGTNCGLSFLGVAKQWAEELSSPRNGYLAAWAIENSRQRCINGGNRTIEYLACSQCVLTVDDYEIVECAVQWLSTNDGQDFIGYATERIKPESEKIKLYEILCKN